MKKRFALLSFLICVFTVNAQILVNTQDKDFPLWTNIDTLKVSKIAQSDNSVVKLRQYMQPLCEKNDAHACFIFAKTYDNFAAGKGTPKDAAVALKFYQKAADLKLAEANFFLSQAYQYNFMNLKTDRQKTLDYLQKTLLYGNSGLKAEAYNNLAQIYDPGGDSEILTKKEKDRSKTRQFLEKSLELQPNSWTMDYIGGLYEEDKDYKTAAKYYLQSDNEQMNLEVAQWMIEGKNLPKDLPQALKIIRNSIDKLEEQGYNKENLNDYMGATNPVYLLNELYQCKKLISKKDLGKWALDYNVCY